MNNEGRGSFDPTVISEWFWAIIDDAKGSREALESTLNKLGRDEIVRFHNEFSEAAAQLSDEPFSDHLSDDISEDAMQDLAEWIVSRGKAFYAFIWSCPERIVDVDTRRGATYSGVADNVFWERFGTSVPYLTE